LGPFWPILVWPRLADAAQTAEDGLCGGRKNPNKRRKCLDLLRFPAGKARIGPNFPWPMNYIKEGPVPPRDRLDGQSGRGSPRCSISNTHQKRSNTKGVTTVTHSLLVPAWCSVSGVHLTRNKPPSCAEPQHSVTFVTSLAVWWGIPPQALCPSEALCHMPRCSGHDGARSTGTPGLGTACACVFVRSHGAAATGEHQKEPKQWLAR
jgi:hypothetical protein